MLRFPNPGSTIDYFVDVYKAAFKHLDGRVFDLDDMVAATVEENLATSSGHTGAEAIARSTRSDRSRDPLYNQLKMYAELFRVLGWIHSTEQKALNFTFTLLGRQVAEAKQHYLSLMTETVLGISYPNHVIANKGNNAIRPFAFLLRTMLATDDELSRDEMIVGPLSAASDRSEDAVPEIAALIEFVRRDRTNIKDALARVSRERKASVNTLKNYTRWPIAVMRDLGWTDKERRAFRDGEGWFQVHRLTESGKNVAVRVSNSVDLRLDQVDQLPFEEKEAVSIVAHYRMLARAEFDVEPVLPQLDQQEQAFARALARLGVSQGKPLLFSPFQSLRIADSNRIFPPAAVSVSNEERNTPAGGTVVGRGSRDHLFVQPILVHQRAEFGDSQTVVLEEELCQLRELHQSAEAAAAAFVQSRESDTQTEFYPLVSGLFRLLGFDSGTSRAGVNYQRWDAWVDLGGTTAPIEIKSPTEEKVLSTKAVRQALENKVVNLARGGLNTTVDTTTLIVGYQIPSERGDMSLLIDDVFKAFNIRIGVIDLRTLSLLAIRAVTEEITVQADQLRTLRGYLHA